MAGSSLDPSHESVEKEENVAVILCDPSDIRYKGPQKRPVQTNLKHKLTSSPLVVEVIKG